MGNEPCSLCKNLNELDKIECLNYECWSKTELPMMLNLKKLILNDGGLRKLPLQLPELSSIEGDHCLLLELSFQNNLRYFNCSNCNELISIHDLPNLIELKCNNSQKLLNIYNLPNLQKLDCSKCESLLDLKKLRKLTVLDCSGCKSLCELPELTKLLSLDCSHCKSLCELPELLNLISLTIICTDIKVIHSFPKLELLNCSCCTECQCNCGCLNRMIITPLPKLKRLDCTHLRKLKKLPQLPKLEILNYNHSYTLNVNLSNYPKLKSNKSEDESGDESGDESENESGDESENESGDESENESGDESGNN
jgi:hypothetical protein